MVKKLWLLLLPASVLVSGCATLDVPDAPPSVLQVQCPRPSPAPAAVMVERQPDFLIRLLEFFRSKPASSSSDSQERPTRSSDSSRPASGS